MDGKCRATITTIGLQGGGGGGGCWVIINYKYDTIFFNGEAYKVILCPGAQMAWSGPDYDSII